MNKTDEVKKLKADIKTLTRKLYRKIIAYYRVQGTLLIKDKKRGIQMYSAAVFGIACNEDGTYRKVCSLTIKDSKGSYPDLVDETTFKRCDWNPNKEQADERLC